MVTKNEILQKIETQSKLLYLELNSKDSNISLPDNSEEQQMDFLNEGNIENKLDLLLFNNSFFNRKIKLKTTKNENYLGIIRTPINSPDDIVVVDGINFNNESKIIKAKSGNYPNVKSVHTAIDENISNLGHLIYILIGIFDNLQENKINFSFGEYKYIEFSNQVDFSQINGDTILINPKHGDENIWAEIKPFCDLPEEQIENKKKEFLDKMKSLRKDTILPLVIPQNNSDLENTFIDSILNSLETEILEYDKSLHSWTMDINDQANFNNILRISYNFSSDAVKLLKLIISISDLKPIILWMTIHTQYKLKLAFDNLGLSNSKPILEEYDKLIKGARNARFHKLFDIYSTINVDLTGINLQAVKLTIFPEYSSSKQAINSLEYEDQQLIEVFSEFTRVTDNSVSHEFWTKNFEIMKSFYDLLQDVGDSIKLLRLF